MAWSLNDKLLAPISGNTLNTGGGNEHRIVVDAAGHLQVDVLSAVTDVGDALESVGLDWLGVAMYGDDGAGGYNLLSAPQILDAYAGTERGIIPLIRDVSNVRWLPIYGMNPNTDNITTFRDFGIPTITYLHGYDGTNWDRLRATSLYANLTTTLGALNVAALTHGEDLEVGAGNSEPIKIRLDDGVIPDGDKHHVVISLNYVFDGNDWVPMTQP